MHATAAPGAPAAPHAPPNRLLALTALFYAVFLGVWAYQTATGIEAVGTRWALFTSAILLYCALSLAAVWRRPDNPQVSVFVATGVSIVATIIWPLPSFDAGYSAAWVAELSIFCLVYTLPVALFVHMAAMIPRPQEGVLRHRWVLPAAYGFAVVSALASIVPYVNALHPFLPWEWSLDQVFAYDRKLNYATNLAGGLACLALLGRAVLREQAPEARRQAAVVFVGLIPWTFRQGRKLVFPLPDHLERITNILSPVTILAFAISFFIAITGFQLFSLGPVMRKSAVYAITTTLLGAAGYAAAVVAGIVVSDALGVQHALWAEALVLVTIGVAYQPVLVFISHAFDRFFYPEKQELRGLQRSLLPELAELTGLGATTRHLTQILVARLRVRSAALVLADEGRDFYRVRAVAGEPERVGAAVAGVVTRQALDRLWPGPGRPVRVRRRGGQGEPAEVARTLDLLGARYLVPVEHRGELAGIITLGDTVSGTEFDARDFESLEMLAQGVSAMVENARLFGLATHDHLTGLAHRRVFEERLEHELQRARRHYRPFAVGVADVDDFKRVNDTLGHHAGDQVLRRLAAVLADQGRGIDVVARYGGEEFALLLPETDEDGARCFGERLVRTVRDAPVPAGERVTVSAGFFVVRAEDVALEPAELVRRADAALYAAKRAGKDRVQVDAREAAVV